MHFKIECIRIGRKGFPPLKAVWELQPVVHPSQPPVSSNPLCILWRRQDYLVLNYRDSKKRVRGIRGGREGRRRCQCGTITLDCSTWTVTPTMNDSNQRDWIIREASSDWRSGPSVWSRSSLWNLAPELKYLTLLLNVLFFYSSTAQKAQKKCLALCCMLSLDIPRVWLWSEKAKIQISLRQMFENCDKTYFYMTGYPIYFYLRLAPAAPEVADTVPLSPCSPR